MVCLSLSLATGAQTTDSSDLYLLTDPRPGAIALRWAPTDYGLFKRAHTEGYRLSRQTLDPTTDRVIATVVLSEKILPYPIPAWKPLTDTSSFATSLASFIYPDQPATSPDDRVFAYGLSLFSADVDFAAALAGGLGFEDSSVEPGKRYRYTVSLGELSGAWIVDSDYRNTPLPPQQPTGDFQRRYVDLSWHRAKTDRIYTSYAVQRSADGGQTFEYVNDRPLVQILNEDNYDTLQYYRDTLPDFKTTFHYRILGTTPFGRHGPPSEVVIGRALPDARELRPTITEMTLDVQENYRISWNIPRRTDRRPVAYEVFSSRSGYTGYESRSGRLPVTDRYWIEEYPVDGDFYRVHAYDEDGFTYVSNPRLMLVDDTDPPSPPPNISGEMDSLGVVTLSWDPSVEDDVKGYRILFSNRPTGYFAQLTARETVALSYRDSVTMDTRAEDVYYKVFAVDYTGNYSPESEAVKVSRPDLQPPTAPVFREISGNETAAVLETALSSSDDVVYHLFQRKNESGEWIDLDTLLTITPIHTFRDESGEAGDEYAYRVVAVDDADLRSATEEAIAARTDTGLRGTITNFTVRVLTTSLIPAISWFYPPASDLEGFQLYRAEADGDLLAYRLLDATSKNLRLLNGTFTYLDRDVRPGTRYTYKLFARHRDGGYSPFTSALAVQLPD